MKSEASMSKFVIVTFPDEEKIDRAIGVVRGLRRKGGIKLYASAVVASDSEGKLSVREITNKGLGGTAVGALFGGLAGMPAGPLAATIGAAGGAAISNSADLINQHAEAAFADKVSRELAPGQAAIVAEVADDGVIPLSPSSRIGPESRIGGVLNQWVRLEGLHYGACFRRGRRR